MLGLLAFCVLIPSAKAPAQSPQDISSRISRIENEIETLNRAVYRGENPPPGYAAGGGTAADIEVRLQQMETQLRDLTGRLEEQTYQIQQLKEQQERALTDMQMRMGDLEGNGRNAAGGGNTPPVTMQDDGNGRYNASPMRTKNLAPDNNSGAQNNENAYQWNSNPAANTDSGGSLGSLSSSANDTAAVAYENAFGLIKNGQYDAAQGQFQDFLNQYPDHALAGNAKYWLGETYYVRGQFDKAARIFAEAFQKYPKSSKAPDNLLKLGMALAAMGNKNDACVALGQMKTQFSTGAGPVLRRAEQEMSRIGC